MLELTHHLLSGRLAVQGGQALTVDQDQGPNLRVRTCADLNRVGIADRPAAVLHREVDGVVARRAPLVGGTGRPLPAIRLRRPGIDDGRRGIGGGDDGCESVRGIGVTARRASDLHLAQGLWTARHSADGKLILGACAVPIGIVVLGLHVIGAGA